MEIWKDVPGYSGLYQVSNLGRIKSLPIDIPRGKGVEHRGSKILKQRLLKKGYLRVVLVKNGIKRQFLSHRLIAMVFIPNYKNKPCIDHINGIKTDNRVENLRWVTHKENSNNPITANRISLALKGKKRTYINVNRKAVIMSKNGVVIRKFESMQHAANFFNAKRNSNIADCCHGRQSRAYGYEWKFVD